MFQKIKDVCFRYPALCLLTGFILVSSISPYLGPALSENFDHSNSTLSKWLLLITSSFLLENPLWNSFLVITLLLLGSSLEKIFGAPKFIFLFALIGVIASFYMSYFSPTKLVNSSSVYVAVVFGMNICMLLKRHRFITQKHKISLAILLALLLLLMIADPALPVFNILVGFIIGFIMSFIVKPQSFSKIIERKWAPSLMQGIIILMTAFIFIYSSKLINVESFKSQFQVQLEEWTAKVDVTRLKQKIADVKADTEEKVVEKSNPIDLSALTPIHVTGDKLYNSILESLLKLDDSVMVGLNNDSDKIFETLQQVLNDHPEIFYFDHSNSRYWTNGQLELRYKYSTSDIEKIREKINVLVKEIFNNHLENNQNDFEKVKAIHDYLVLNTRYDYQNYKADTIPYESYNIVGTLLNQTAVCDGYAKTTQYLLNLLGVDVRYVTGTANSGLHAWNKVKIDGEWFNLDVTWDDPVPDRVGEVSYRYFLVTDKYLKKDHHWEEELHPKSEATTYMHISRNE